MQVNPIPGIKQGVLLQQIWMKLGSDVRHGFVGRVRRMLRALALTGCLTFIGCGATYRPVVSAISPVGPAGQPTKYAIAVSTTGPASPGLLTFVDVSGDTVVSTPSLPTTVDTAHPLNFALTTGGATGYLANSAGVLSTFGAGNPPALRTSNIAQTTLVANANPQAISTFTTNGIGLALFIPEAGATSNLGVVLHPPTIAVLTSTPELVQELAVGANPVYVVGTNGGARAYAISQNTYPGNGQIAAIETTTSSPSISATLPVGQTPVYGVMTADGSRAYIVNKGSGTVTVINAQTNALDATTPVIPVQPPNSAPVTLGTNPVWALLVQPLSELLVLNQGDGVSPGTLSIINVLQCNAIAQPTNPDCISGNLSDAVGFGTVIATVPVGINPTMVTALSDGSRAYVVNSGNAGKGFDGSVSVVNLTSNIVTATLPATTADSGTNPTYVYGHPNTIAATTGTPTGKIYVTAPDSQYMTIIRTDLDQVDTHISLQGFGVRVLTSTN